MTDTQLAAHHLAQAIAGFRIAERNFTRALIVAETTMRNVASRHGIRWNVRSITQP